MSAAAIGSADRSIIVMSAAVDIVVVSKKQSAVYGKIFQILFRNYIVDDNDIATLYQLIIRSELFNAVERCGKFFLLFSSVSGVEQTYGKPVAAQQCGTLLHVTLYSSDDAVVLADIDYVFHFNSSR